MESNFQLLILAPYNTIFNGKVKSLTIKTIEGEITILSSFQNFITTTIASTIKIITDKNEDIFFEIKDGVLKVQENKVFLCTEISK